MKIIRSQSAWHTGLSATWCLATTLMAAPAIAAATPSYPPTARQPVSDVYHGVTVSEDYRWLENGNDPAVKTWIGTQNAYTHTLLSASPTHAALRKELKQLVGKGPIARFDFSWTQDGKSGSLFAMKRKPPKNQPMLVMLSGRQLVAGKPGAKISETTIVDPNRINAKGTTAIDWFVPALDGKHVAVSMSDNGSEDGSLHLFDTKTGKELPDIVPHVQYPTGGGSAVWTPDGQGIYYTRYPRGDERPKEDANFYEQVYFHKLGTPTSADTYVIGKEFPRIAEIALSTTRDGRYVLADVSNGDGGEHGFYLRNPAGDWAHVADFADGIRAGALGMDGRLYLLALKDSPRGRVLALPLDKPELAAATLVIPETDAVIESMTPTASRLYVDYLVGGPSDLRMFALDGKPLGSLGAEPVASVGVGVSMAGDAILFGSQSFVRPFAWYAFDPAKNAQPAKTSLTAPPKYHMGDVEVIRDFAVSKDGTKVPINIVRNKGIKLDGKNPALLTGYGGYGLSMRPYFSRRNVLWLRHGGVFALANLRGGGEYGENWHLAGNLTRKQNVFDDFIACAQYLTDKSYTSPAHLAIEGGSNGGLMMGAVLVQRPEMFRAVVSHVGIYDALREELLPNGAFNVTEFGSVKDPDQFRAMLAYSPYHNVHDGVAYPAVLLAGGENDGRVEPYNSRKMVARLQAATASDRPILLRSSSDAGHGQGMGLAAGIELDADVFTFLFDQLGMDAH